MKEAHAWRYAETFATSTVNQITKGSATWIAPRELPVVNLPVFTQLAQKYVKIHELGCGG